MNNKKKISMFIRDERGFAMTSTTMFIFIIISIFAIYLARFTVTSKKSSAYFVQEIRARNLAQTGLDIALNAVSSSYSQLMANGFSGELNKGTYSVVLDEDAFHDESALPYHHYNVLESVGKIAEVKSNARILISSYPNAFNLAFFGNNNGNSTFSTSSSINGDIYFNGDFGTLNLSAGSNAYSSLLNPSNNGVFHGLPLVEFPSFDNSYYENLLSSVSGTYESNETQPVLVFDGVNDYVQMPTDFIPNSKFSINFWFKPIKNNWNGVILDASNGGYYFFIDAKQSQIRFWFEDKDDRDIQLSVNYTFNKNQWYHIVAVGRFGYSTHQLYINGALAGTYNRWVSSKPSFKTPRLGKQRQGYGTGHTPFEGALDEFAIWNVPLNSSNVAALYNSGDGLDASINSGNYSKANNLIGYWKIDEGAGTTIYDETGNNYNGSLINGPTWGTRESSGSSGIVTNQTINLTGMANNILVNDGMLTLENCTINGPGTVMTSGNLTISGNSTIGPSVNIISGGDLTVSGNVNIGNSVENYSVIYCKDNINLSGNTTFYGVLIGTGQSSSFSNANLYGASYLESQTVSISNTTIVGSLVSRYSPTITSSYITKGNLPDIFGTSIGFNPSIVPGSHLEY